MKLILAQIIHHAHTGIVAFSLVGWLLPTPEMLQIYILIMVAIMGQWAVCDNKCILTIWEDKLRGQAHQAGSESFIGRVLERLTGWKPSEKAVDRLSYSIGCACIFGAIVRLKLTKG
jgi:hypothetical protein